MPSMDTVVTDLGPVKAHVRPVAAEVAGRWTLYFIWGAPGRGTGDHADGLALDFMAYDHGGGVDDPGPIRGWIGNQIASYLVDQRRRLNITYVIWNRRIASARSSPDWSWRGYDGDDPHTNHVHVSFEAIGTYQPPTGRPGDDDMQLSDRVQLEGEWAERQLGLTDLSVDGALGYGAVAGVNSVRIIERLDKQNELLAEIRDAVRALRT
jgi:hypothetical protein